MQNEFVEMYSRIFKNVAEINSSQQYEKDGLTIKQYKDCILVQNFSRYEFTLKIKNIEIAAKRTVNLDENRLDYAFFYVNNGNMYCVPTEDLALIDEYLSMCAFDRYLKNSNDKKSFLEKTQKELKKIVGK